MIKSMTGFGRGEYSDSKRSITVEIRAVNHRYCDVTVKMPRRYSFAEEKIKAAVKEKLRRGKIEVAVMVENVAADDVQITLNTGLAAQYYAHLQTLQETFALDGAVTLTQLSAMPDVLKIVPAVEDEEELLQAILKPTAEAAENLDHMRMTEGQKLADDLLAKGENIRRLLTQIADRAPQVAVDYTRKLRERIAELIDGAVEIPEDRILVEAAIFADKCAIDEEITRLDSHLLQLREIITKSSQPDGKKLDFLVQEMNREANTIGAKANDMTITGAMLEIKSEIEKIREQVQNIE